MEVVRELLVDLASQELVYGVEWGVILLLPQSEFPLDVSYWSGMLFWMAFLILSSWYSVMSSFICRLVSSNSDSILCNLYPLFLADWFSRI